MRINFNKAILLVLGLGFLNLAKADISVSGYQEFFAGSADQTIASGTTEHGIAKGGMSDGTYTRLTATYSSTLDSGIELAGTYNIGVKDCDGTSSSNCGVTNFNNVVLSGSFGTIGIGEIFDVGASMLSRYTANIPTDIEVMINDGELAMIMLRMVEIIGEDSFINLGSESLYFIISTLNKLNVDKIFNNFNSLDEIFNYFGTDKGTNVKNQYDKNSDLIIGHGFAKFYEKHLSIFKNQILYLILIIYKCQDFIILTI